MLNKRCEEVRSQPITYANELTFGRPYFFYGNIRSDFLPTNISPRYVLKLKARSLIPWAMYIVISLEKITISRLDGIFTKSVSTLLAIDFCAWWPKLIYILEVFFTILVLQYCKNWLQYYIKFDWIIWYCKKPILNSNNLIKFCDIIKNK